MRRRYTQLREEITQRLMAAGGGAATRTLNEWGADKRDLDAMCRDQTLVRIKRGFYILATTTQAAFDWQQLRTQHLRHVTAAAADARCVAGLRSAALAWGLPVSEIPPHPEVIRPPGSSGQLHTRTLRRSLVPAEIRVIHGVTVTSLARTAVDIALDLPTPRALVTVDAALRRGVLRAEMTEVLNRFGSVRGCRTARQTLEWADPHAESALESRGRGELLIRGAPLPWCNVTFRLGDTQFRVDEWWPDIPLVGEADGALKYSGDRNANALWREKLRQEWFEDILGLSVFRHTDAEVRLNPNALYARFTRRAVNARQRLWTPPAQLEIFQRPLLNSPEPLRWLRRRDEPEGRESA